MQAENWKHRTEKARRKEINLSCLQLESKFNELEEETRSLVGVMFLLWTLLKRDRGQKKDSLMPRSYEVNELPCAEA